MKSLLWVNAVAGVWLILSPAVLAYGNGTAAAVDMVLGVAIIVTALWAANSVAVAAVWTQILLAVWLFIAPWALGYSYVSRALGNDLVVATVVALIALASTTARRVPGTGRP
jgi:hypothetical protein